MAKILHIANFNLLKVQGPSQNSMQRKISNGLTRIGHNVVDYSDRDLCRMFGFGHMNFWGKKKVNEHLIKFCKEIKPDAIVMGHVDTITLDTFREIKSAFPDLKILEWCVDSIAPDSKANSLYNRDCDFMLSRLQKQSAVTDFILITTGKKELLQKLKTSSNIVGFLPNIVDKSMEAGHVYTLQNPIYDLLFAATPTLKRKVCGKWLSMNEIAQHITSNMPEIQALFPGLLGNPKMGAAKYQDACASSAMGLSISHVNDVYLYQSDRLAHIIGNGSLAFLEKQSGYQDFFDENEIVFYETLAELYDKIDFYKKNPSERMRIAKTGHDKYVHLFNETRVAKYMSDLLVEGKDTADNPWVIEV